MNTDAAEGMTQLNKEDAKAPGSIPESYLLCRECDGTWVDSRHGECTACAEHTTSRDFRLCLSCALRDRRCQHCAEQVEVRIANC